MERVSEKYRSFYESHYEGTSEWRTLCALDKARNIVDLCAALQPARVLEVGAGDGAVLEQLGRLGFADRLSALEISPTALEALRARGIERLDEARLFDGGELPYADDAFDLVVLSHVVEHLEHPRMLLYEARRVARHVFVEVPLEDTLRAPLDYRPNSMGHINFYTPAAIRRLLQTCDLEVLEQRVTNPSLAIYRAESGVRGAVRFLLKEGLLRAAPDLATRVWTYHTALLCRRAAPQTAGTGTADSI